jgi:hypothetical protein
MAKRKLPKNNPKRVRDAALSVGESYYGPNGGTIEFGIEVAARLHGMDACHIRNYLLGVGLRELARQHKLEACVNVMSSNDGEAAVPEWVLRAVAGIKQPNHTETEA